MPEDERIKTIRLCGMLVYLEAAQRQEKDIDTCTLDITEFLNRIKTKYTGKDKGDVNVDAV